MGVGGIYMANSKKRPKVDIQAIIKEREDKEKAKFKGVYYDEDSATWGFRLAIKDGDGQKFDTDRKGYKTAFQAKTARE